MSAADQYQAPIDEILASLQTVGLDQLLALEPHGHVDVAAVHDVLRGFGKLAQDMLAPSDRIGDRDGARFDPLTGSVTLPPEVAVALRHYVDGGWQSLAADPAYGGGGFPWPVGTAIHEMFGSANLALSLNPMLTQSAIELLDRWATDTQRATVLPKLVDGSWTGTMNLTEPDAGSDLGAVRTMAAPLDDHRWALNGTKIFITWGEHDLSDNIVHLVLARTPDAPAGTRGISLFLVPKLGFGGLGQEGQPNGVHCRGIEHKLGIHASPTCVLEFADAVGELVGPISGGMPAMFSMMNPARLAVGVQGVSIAERSFQKAHSYAETRIQGTPPGGKPGDAIIEHPDVQRMLLDIASTRDAIRLLTYRTAVAGDLARHLPDPEARSRWQRRTDLMTPLAKSWPTDQGVRLASLAVQVHGGMGFIEETGIAQQYRDARIPPIYEGTNGIQAIDLVGRKVARDAGTAARELFDEIELTVQQGAAHADLQGVSAHLAATVASARAATDWIIEQFAVDTAAALGGACAYLDLLAVAAAGELMLLHALRAQDEPERWARALCRARFFAIQHLEQRPTLGAVTVGTLDLRSGI